MKNALLFFIVVLSAHLLCIHSASAQTGWKWGVGSNNGADVEQLGGFTIDRSGNVFAAMWNDYPDTVIFGPFSVQKPWSEQQLIVTKVDSSGNYQWVVTTQNSGGNCNPNNIVADSFGNLYVLGTYFDGNGTFSVGSFTLTDTMGSFPFLIKISPTGTVLWTKIVASVAAGSGLGIDAFGNIYITGFFWEDSIIIGSTELFRHGTIFRNSIFLAKYNTLGNPIWAKSFGSSESFPSQNNNLVVTNAGTIYFNGYNFPDSALIIGGDTLTRTSFFLAAIDSSGGPIWTVTLDSNMYNIEAIAADNWGSLYVTGGFTNPIIVGHDTLVATGNSDIFVVKYDSSGSVKWAKTAGGGLISDEAFGISADLCGNVWLCGMLNGAGPGYIGPVDSPMDFNGHLLWAAPGSFDAMFIAEYDKSGNYITSIALPSGGDDQSSIVTDNRGSFYISGDYVSKMVFRSDTLQLNIGSGENFFVAKYTYFDDQAPSFTNGAKQTITICGDTTLDSLLSVFDLDTGQTETWSILDAPIHGTAVVSYTAVSNGDTLTPSGLSYRSVVGYSGIDSFKIKLNDCCNGSDTITIYVTVKPLPFVANITELSTVCKGATISLTDTSMSGTWSISNNNAMLLVDILIGVYAGIDTVRYAVTNSCGTATTATAITVEPLPDAGIITGPMDLCVGDSIILAETVAGGTWLGSNQLAKITGSVTVTGISPGVDTVSYSISNSCGTATAFQQVTINPLPASSQILQNGDLLSVGADYSSYQWTLNGTAISGATMNTYIVDNAGDYSVQVINAYGYPYIYPGLVVSDCGIADMQIFPNPSQNIVYIQWCKNVTAKLNCVDGKLVKIIENAKQVYIGDLPNGTYLLNIFDADDTWVTTKRITKL